MLIGPVKSERVQARACTQLWTYAACLGSETSALTAPWSPASCAFATFRVPARTVRPRCWSCLTTRLPVAPVAPSTSTCTRKRTVVAPSGMAPYATRHDAQRTSYEHRLDSPSECQRTRRHRRLRQALWWRWTRRHPGRPHTTLSPRQACRQCRPEGCAAGRWHLQMSSLSAAGLTGCVTCAEDDVLGCRAYVLTLPLFSPLCRDERNSAAAAAEARAGHGSGVVRRCLRVLSNVDSRT